MVLFRPVSNTVIAVDQCALTQKREREEIFISLSLSFSHQSNKLDENKMLFGQGNQMLDDRSCHIRLKEKKVNFLCFDVFL